MDAGWTVPRKKVTEGGRDGNGKWSKTKDLLSLKLYFFLAAFWVHIPLCSRFKIRNKILIRIYEHFQTQEIFYQMNYKIRFSFAIVKNQTAKIKDNFYKEKINDDTYI